MQKDKKVEQEPTLSISAKVILVVVMALLMTLFVLMWKGLGGGPIITPRSALSYRIRLYLKILNFFRKIIQTVDYTHSCPIPAFGPPPHCPLFVREPNPNHPYSAPTRYQNGLVFMGFVEFLRDRV